MDSSDQKVLQGLSQQGLQGQSQRLRGTEQVVQVAFENKGLQQQQSLQPDSSLHILAIRFFFTVRVCLQSKQVQTRQQQRGQQLE